MIAPSISQVMRSLKGPMPAYKLHDLELFPPAEPVVLHIPDFPKVQEKIKPCYVCRTKMKTFKEFINEHRIARPEQLAMTAVVVDGKIQLRWLVDGEDLDFFDHVNDLYTGSDQPHSRYDD